VITVFQGCWVTSIDGVVALCRAGKDAEQVQHLPLCIVARFIHLRCGWRMLLVLLIVLRDFCGFISIWVFYLSLQKPTFLNFTGPGWQLQLNNYLLPLLITNKVNKK